jgi:hypothetical protein
MKTRKEQMTAGAVDGYNNFMGDDSDYQDWLGFLGQTRDSKALERSNFRAGLIAIGGEGVNVRVKRFGHWACGWIEEIYVKPGTPEAVKAEAVKNALENYPVVNDEDFSREEEEEAGQIWRDCYTWRDRADYIRQHESQFEHRDYQELIACVRGVCFLGYAGELLN